VESIQEKWVRGIEGGGGGGGRREERNKKKQQGEKKGGYLEEKGMEKKQHGSIQQPKEFAGKRFGLPSLSLFCGSQCNRKAAKLGIRKNLKSRKMERREN